MSPNTDTSRPRMTLVVGGTRSGKSQYSEKIASGFGKKILYVATAEVWDGSGSLEYRIRKHRERRPQEWPTLECPRNVAATVQASVFWSKWTASFWNASPCLPPTSCMTRKTLRNTFRFRMP